MPTCTSGSGAHTLADFTIPDTKGMSAGFFCETCGAVFDAHLNVTNLKITWKRDGTMEMEHVAD